MTSSLPILAIGVLAFIAGAYQPLPEPIVRVVEVPVTVIPLGGIRPIKKIYTDRILPAVEVSTQAKVMAEVENVPARPAVKRAAERRRLPCKTGRTRNAQGLCGRWKT